MQCCDCLKTCFSLLSFPVRFLSFERFGAMAVRENLQTMFFCRFSRSKACKTASKKLINLQQLQIWVQIHDCAPKFSLREKWIKPLLQFRRLTYGKACTNDHVDNSVLLETVKIHIQTRWSKDPLGMFLNNQRLARASTELHVLYGQAVSLAIKGAREEEAMTAFNAAWEGKYKQWKHHLQFAPTGW